jgi:hypothetical protein
MVLARGASHILMECMEFCGFSITWALFSDYRNSRKDAQDTPNVSPPMER